MPNYLEFQQAQCKDCYRCLRECPVKAIDAKDHQATIIEDRCILCGRCTHACPQNAKVVHSEMDAILQMLESGEKVVASVAPSFISSLGQKDFTALRLALAKLGFHYAEETAVGAAYVTKEYKKLLAKGDMKNFITSCCPAVCQLIQKYYPKALPFLAPVDSPMVAHAKMLKHDCPETKVVFVGPCIAKKKEGAESGYVDAVMTFEELHALLEERGIDLSSIVKLDFEDKHPGARRAKAYPVSRGVIRSFDTLPEGYRYVAVDGPKRCMDTLENIESLDRVFIEMNICPDGCINGPCSIPTPGGALCAELEVVKYLERELEAGLEQPLPETVLSMSHAYPRLHCLSRPGTDREIEEVLHRTGKMKPSDELNCGACGYQTCREKAWAVINGYANIEMCLPFMRKRAESLAVDIVHNSPEGVILLDKDMNIIDVNTTAMRILGAADAPDHFCPQPAANFFATDDFYLAQSEKRSVGVNNLLIDTTQRYVDMTITPLENQQLLFAILKDVTDEVNYDKKLDCVKAETIETADKVIMKQMRVAQEIASLLGETTAETKVAMLKLKKMLQESSRKEE